MFLLQKENPELKSLQVRPPHPWTNSTTVEFTFTKPKLLFPLQHTMHTYPAKDKENKLETKKVLP